MMNSKILKFENILLAYFDIQGYSAFIKNTDFEECVKNVEDLISLIKKDATLSVSQNCRVKHWIFSDSIILIPEIENRPLEIKDVDFLILMSSIFFVRSLIAGLPLRGAIGAGNFYKNDEILISSALIDAVKYEKKQNWLGAVITPSALTMIQDISPMFETKYLGLHNFNLFLRKGRIPWKPSDQRHLFGVSKNENCFYIKPKMNDPKWKRYLPNYFNINEKVHESDCLYGQD